VRLIDFCITSTLGLRVIKKKKKKLHQGFGLRASGFGFRVPGFGFSGFGPRV